MGLQDLASKAKLAEEDGNITIRFPTGQLIVLAAIAATVIGAVWISNRDLSMTVNSLKNTVGKLESTVDNLPTKFPPPWLLDKISSMEREEERLQAQIDRLESRYLGEPVAPGRYVP